jgi:hypothetical protein
MRHLKCLSRISFSILFVLVVTTLNGCAIKGTGATFTVEEPMADKAVVIHYRLSRGAGSGAQYDVMSNDRPLTCIGNGGYFKQVTEPGNIVYKTRLQTRGGPFLLGQMIDNAIAKFKETYSLDVEAGKVYYLRWKVGPMPKIEQIPEKEALLQLKGLRSFLPLETTGN